MPEYPESPRSNKPNKIKDTPHPGDVIPRSPTQMDLELKIDRQIEVDGIGMGVLSDGTAFLNGRGLARMCGIDSSRISEMGANWNAVPSNQMTARVKELLKLRGATLEHPYVEIRQRSGNFYAYPDILCVAVLEYYAFDAPNPREEAKKNFRLLAGKALHDFICTQVGYDPAQSVPDVWRQFHDRVALTYNTTPKGFFGIFKEMADMIVTLGQAGAHIDEKFVPDISVGLAWGKHWTTANLAETHGDRIKFDHNYPDYFPQAESNPQDCWCYPESALGEFRRWLREDYIGGGKFEKYIKSKVKQNAFPASFAQLAITAYGLDAQIPEQ